MKKGIFFALLFIIITLSGCIKKADNTPITAQKELPIRASSANAEADTTGNTYRNDEGVVYAETFYVTPKFLQNDKDMPGINAYYIAERSTLEEVWQNTFIPRAHEELEASKATGGNFNPYLVSMDFKVLKNSGGYLSVWREINEFTGGAHGSSRIACENWVQNTDDYARVSLGDIFNCDIEEARKQLLDFAVAEANDRMEETDGMYFQNFEDTMRNVWDSNDFYITENSVGIVFQEYSIGPAITGIQSFEINFAELSGLKNELK